MRPMIKYLKENRKQSLIGAEIGVACGENAMDMVMNLHLKELHLIDHWEPYRINNQVNTDYVDCYDVVLERFIGYDNVLIHKRSSIDMSKWFRDGYFDFVYIDACHDYKAVRADIDVWWEKIIKTSPLAPLQRGGVIGGHDYSGGWPGVRRAVNEFCARLRGELIEFEFFNQESDWWIVK